MRKVRRLCATAVVVLLMAPMTGCTADDFFGAAFLSLGCATSGFGPDPCIAYRLSIAAGRYRTALENCIKDLSACASSICPLRSQLLELAAEQCTNLQEQAQHATVPSGSPQSQCNVGSDQDTVDNARALGGCP
jgi:hypothetical protein